MSDNAENDVTIWPPLPPVGDYVQTSDGGVWRHVEWAKFANGGGCVTDWRDIGGRVIAHGTVHWRDPFRAVIPPGTGDDHS